MARTQRKAVDGRVDYTVCTNGVIRKWGREVPVSTDHYPGLETFTMDGVDHHHLVDEVVLRTFIGWPRYPDGRPCASNQALTVVHADGNPSNNLLANLSWLILPEWVEAAKEYATRSLMCAANLRRIITSRRTS